MIKSTDIGVSSSCDRVKFELYVTKNNFDYFEVDYYEKNIKPILSQPREVTKPVYSENGLDIYLFNGKEYVLPGDIAMLCNKEVFKYLFQDASDKEFNFVKLKDEGNLFCMEYVVLLSGIPATVVNGRLSIEYEYYKNNILPITGK